jgi:hypothetical protein
VAGHKEGNGESGKSNDDSNKEVTAMLARAMATIMKGAMATDKEGNVDVGKCHRHWAYQAKKEEEQINVVPFVA